MHNKPIRLTNPVVLLALITLMTAPCRAASPAPDWQVGGGKDGIAFGNSVATAGDVNGDGFSDVLAGAPLYSTLIGTPGQVRAFYGSANGLPTTPSWSRLGSSNVEHFGSVVSTAGDVNGDGFDDALVAAPDFTNGQTEEGRVDLFLGSASGLSAAPAWSAESNQGFSRFGIAVAGGGDLNGDGYDDVVVGAPDFSNGQSTEGRLFVYYGSASGLQTNPGATREINQAGARLGRAVAMAGDVNGDGFGDVIAGAWTYTNGQTAEGAALVYLGTASGLAVNPAWIAEGDQANGYFGGAVTTAGDVNGDGYADVAVGGYLYDSPEMDGGIVRVYHGNATGVASTPALTLTAGQAGAGFGCSVSTAGDVNGDGYADLAVGAYLYSGDENVEGTVRVYRGGPAGLSPAYQYYSGGQTNSFFGASVAVAGDVDGDSRSEILVGAYSYDGLSLLNDGRIFLFAAPEKTVSTLPNWTYVGPEQSNLNSVWTDVTSGDVNGDGYSDMALSHPQVPVDGLGAAGRVDVFYGGPQGFGNAPDWSFAGTVTYEQFGTSVAVAGDLNGDGYDDMAVGASGRWYEPDPETVRIFRGGPNGLESEPWIVLNGETGNSQYGSAVAGAGDVNGDGVGDLLVGAPGFDVGIHEDAGKVYLYLGSPSGIPPGSILTMTGTVTGGSLGFQVSSAGDVNADGFGDWMVSEPTTYINGMLGRVHVFRGSATPDFVVDSALTTIFSNDGFGYELASGDVNGDGITDLAVGAPGTWFNGEANVGRAVVYFGPVTASYPNAGWVKFGTDDEGDFGGRISMAGDLDGDGASELLIGAPRYGLPSEVGYGGKAYLYRYPLNPPTPIWTLEGTAYNENVGRDAALIGDVNGDGRGEMVIASNNGTGFQTNATRFRLYYGNATPGLPFRPRQTRAATLTPVAMRGGTMGEPLSIHGLARSAAGRGLVRVQWEIEPTGTPFDDGAAITEPAIDTGAPIPGEGSRADLAIAPAVQPETTYRWRMRFIGDSPFFPASRWVHPTGFEPGLYHLRVTPASISGTPEEDPSPGGPSLELVDSNPFRGSTALAFDLPQPGSIRLELFDVTGRLVRRLVDEPLEAGSHRVDWDGRTDAGEIAGSGVYFARLDTGRALATARVIRVR